ncbi:MAG: SynChlorMet cassette protein ScmC [Syntrophaceae bacterium]|nr:SynChlorMet cassette protein ScmC [Syntrophaceae bacterium]
MIRKGYYSVELADGCVWGLEACAGTEDWVDNLAAVLGLTVMEAGMPGCLLSFRRRPARSRPGLNGPVPFGPTRFGDSPGVGWRRYLLPDIVMWENPATRHTICLLPETGTLEEELEQMRRVLLPLYWEALRRGGLPLHAALAETGGRGVILAGRSGAGKSTCCRRLEPPWMAQSDDLVLVVRDEAGRFLAHPLPTWSAVRKGIRERPWNINRPIPLEGIFFLEQAAEDGLEPLGGASATLRIRQSALQVLGSLGPCIESERDVRANATLFENAADLAASLPSCILRVSLTGRFWEKIEEALEKGDSPLFQACPVASKGCAASASCRASASAAASPRTITAGATSGRPSGSAKRRAHRAFSPG